MWLRRFLLDCYFESSDSMILFCLTLTFMVGGCSFIPRTMDGGNHEFRVFYASNTSHLRVDMWQQITNFPWF